MGALSKMKILLVGEEKSTLSLLQDVLSSVNLYEVENISPQKEIVFSGKAPGIIVLDLDDISFQISYIEQWKKITPETFFLGYTQKPKQLSAEVQNKLSAFIASEDLDIQFMSQVSRLRDLYFLKQNFNSSLRKIIGKSSVCQTLRRTIEKVLPGKGIVLIQGESGSGKELVARAIASIHPKTVVVNCSAIAENLFESELFGHVRGSFTGAASERTGLFEEAAGGVLFLDEIGDMPLPMQSKLLRTLQDGEFRAVGSNKTKQVSVRIICATNRDLKKEIQTGRFREDLFYRIHVIPIEVPPLRERKEDIPELINHFLFLYSPKDIPKISPEAWDILMQYSWPGNIRELENTIHRAISLMDDNTITPKEIQIDSLHHEPLSPREPFHWKHLSYFEFKEYQKKQECDFILSKIKENHGSITQTAKSFEMQRTALYNRAARIGLNLNELRKNGDF